MSTRIRIEETGPGVYTILAPDVRIPFRGTRAAVVHASQLLAAMMSTAFFDVELDDRVQRRGPVSAPSRKPSFWSRLRANHVHGKRSGEKGITSEHLGADERDFQRITREARDIDKTVARLQARDKDVRPRRR